MSNFRVVDGLIGLGILGTLVLGGLGLSLDHSIQHKFEVLPYSGSKGGSTNSPLKVRGGSMTVRTNSSKGWQGNNSPFCSDSADISHLEFIDVTTTAGSNYVPLTLDHIAVTVGWTIDIVGRLPNGNASKHGIEIQSQRAPCPSGTGPNSVLLSSKTWDNTSYSTFYPESSGTLAGVNEEGSGGYYYAKRFEDTSSGCQGPSPNTSATGDEDLCERIHSITLTLQTSPVQTYVYHCPNGECVVGIGKPK